jgi:peptidoglycan/LPS O-acetylase OafA/YrhL
MSNVHFTDSRSKRDQRILSLMSFTAVTLAVASFVHTLGSERGAAIPEALICLALIAGIVAFVRAPERGALVALAANAFAVFGFLVGLTFTLSGGAAADVVYHLTMLPVLAVTAALLIRRTESGRGR